MPESTSTPEYAPEKEPYQEVMVAVGVEKNRLAHEIRQQGEFFPLGSFFSQESNMLGSDKFREVYFRTGSGNIYRLNEHGELMDMNESVRKQTVSGVMLRKEDLETQILEVGKPFSYGRNGTTTSITEIVPVTQKQYNPPESIKELTKGRTNPILENFNAALSKIPREKR